VYEKHQEGKVTFLRPPLQKVPSTSMPVFYNPKSELNRDLSILALHVFLDQHKKTNVRVCTPLAGTGVRAIRIAREVPGIRQVIASDANPIAVELIKKNRVLNGVSDIVDVHHNGANQLLTQYTSSHQRFDVIDIDPFGSPRDFFHSAISSIKPHAILCLTATDMPVLVGIRRRTCIKRYSAVPMKSEYAHELALRILLGSVVREAAAQNIGLIPLLSFSIDHYIRLYCEATKGDEKAWFSLSKLGFIVHCGKCGFRSTSQGLIPPDSLCPNCEKRIKEQAGPLWIDQIADKNFIENLIQQLPHHAFGTKRRISSLLETLLGEVEGPPTYFNLHQLADKLDIPVPPFRLVIDELHKTGDFASRTHFSPHAIRTTADEKHLCQILIKLNEKV
jgi:tRNA (guanine26-N2/guanine27-N2)-dimethyltransferase